MGQTTNIIELKHITKTYEDGYTAVSDFNLEVKQGEFITFLGPSGCGKTTTLRMIAGFDIPTEGEILLNGTPITSLPPNKRPINTVFQRYALFPHMNIYENIAFGLRQKKTPEKAIAKKVNAYANYEYGIREPSVDIIKRLCKFYNVSSDYLLGIKDD